MVLPHVCMRSHTIIHVLTPCKDPQALQDVLDRKRALRGEPSAQPAPESSAAAAAAAAAAPSTAAGPASPLAEAGAPDSPLFPKVQLSEAELQLITDVVAQVLARNGAAPAAGAGMLQAAGGSGASTGAPSTPVLEGGSSGVAAAVQLSALGPSSLSSVLSMTGLAELGLQLRMPRAPAAAEGAAAAAAAMPAGERAPPGSPQVVLPPPPTPTTPTADALLLNPGAGGLRAQQQAHASYTFSPGPATPGSSSPSNGVAGSSEAAAPTAHHRLSSGSLPSTPVRSGAAAAPSNTPHSHPSSSLSGGPVATAAPRAAGAMHGVGGSGGSGLSGQLAPRQAAPGCSSVHDLLLHYDTGLAGETSFGELLQAEAGLEAELAGLGMGSHCPAAAPSGSGRSAAAAVAAVLGAGASAVAERQQAPMPQGSGAAVRLSLKMPSSKQAAACTSSPDRGGGSPSQSLHRGGGGGPLPDVSYAASLQRAHLSAAAEAQALAAALAAAEAQRGEARGRLTQEYAGWRERDASGAELLREGLLRAALPLAVSHAGRGRLCGAEHGAERCRRLQLETPAMQHTNPVCSTLHRLLLTHVLWLLAARLQAAPTSGPQRAAAAAAAQAGPLPAAALRAGVVMMMDTMRAERRRTRR